LKNRTNTGEKGNLSIEAKIERREREKRNLKKGFNSENTFVGEERTATRRTV
jgi:hypothetical protein